MGRFFDLMIRRACTEEVGFVRHEHRASPEVTADSNNSSHGFLTLTGFPGGAVVKNPPANTGDAKDTGSIPGLGRYPEVGQDRTTAPVFLPGKFHGRLQSMGSPRVGHD